MKLRSWELWTSLFQHPLGNAPLLRWQQRQVPPPAVATLRRLPAMLTSDANQSLLVTLGLTASAILCAANLTALIRFIVPIIIGIGLLALMGIVILPGMNLALQVGTRLYRAHLDRRYELLALTPPGKAALYWSLVMFCLRDDGLSRRLRKLLLDFTATLVVPLIAGLIALEIVAVLMVVVRLEEGAPLFGAVTTPLVLIVLLRQDYVQSMVTAALLSLVVPALLDRRSGFWLVGAAPLIFVILQLTLYLALVIGFGAIHPRLMQFQGTEIAVLIEVSLGLVLLAVIRELLITGLWRLAVAQFGTDLLSLGLD